MKLFFRSKKTHNETNTALQQPPESQPSTSQKGVSWPTAMERATAARQAQKRGNIMVSTRSSGAHPTRMLFCPSVGKDLLSQYEDCRRSHHKDNDDSDSESGNDDNDDDQAKPYSNSHSTTITTKLHKPVKPNRLLQHALTNANGDAWRRQRPLVQRALGDAAVTKKVAVPAAITAALHLLPKKDHADEATTTTVVEIEVRQFSLKVASASMIAAVFGKTSLEPKQQLQLETAIYGLFCSTLLPIRGDAEKAAALNGPLQDILQQFADRMKASDQQPCCDPCLAFNLLKQEEHNNTVKTKETLSRDEVISNCHSALLAGTQTIATTLAGCLLHLANYPTDDSSDRSSYRAVVNETLRILPPVASLPRCPVNGELHIPTTAAACSATQQPKIDDTVVLPEGSVLLLDVLSMAHCPSTSDNGNKDDTTNCPSTDTTESNDEDSTWNFCPANQTRSVPRAYPWGFGDRACPAGNLSVSCIAAVLETLLVQERWKWCLLNDKADRRWLSTVSYQPTLTYPSPLWLNFSRT